MMSDKKEEIQKARKAVREELGEKLATYKSKESLIKAALEVLKRNYDLPFEGLDYKAQVSYVVKYFKLNNSLVLPLPLLGKIRIGESNDSSDQQKRHSSKKPDPVPRKNVVPKLKTSEAPENKKVKIPSLKGLNLIGAPPPLGDKPSLASVDHKREVEAIFKELLGFKSLPYAELKKLTNERINELRRLNKLVLWYEKDDVIKKYLARESNYSGSHPARTKLDFYHRALQQRQHYIDELVGDLEADAISSATIEDDWANTFAVLYLMSNVSKIESPLFQNCDYTKIDKVLHRLDDWNSRKDDELRGLYHSDKAAFYREVLKSTSLTQKIEDIQSMAENLPVSKQRRESLATLNSLYQDKKYLAVYALALPQVEGVFTEMMNSFGNDHKVKLNGTEKNRKDMKALPDKAMFVSRKIAKTDFLFDYFIYCLPEKRNRFSHTGLPAKGEDEKVMCYDIITDLYFVFQMFLELDNPLVRLKRLTLSLPDSKTSFIDVVEFLRLSGQAKKHNESYATVDLSCASYLSIIQGTPAIRERIFREALSNVQATLNRAGFFAEERYGEGKGLAHLLKKEKTDTSLRADLVKYLSDKRELNDVFETAIEFFEQFKDAVAPEMSEVEKGINLKFEGVKKSAMRIKTILRNG